MNKKLLAIMAQMYSVNARVEGMKAENMARDAEGMSAAYEDIHFFQAEQELMALALAAES